ncbi:MAG: hypothetical protein AVDCRST_MAG74-3141 [uncultured Pyrinomonadaceae bacterium]|uniref:Uncharacterized protein n=1 Tax=uncultured Pyrinomonadaceae bacterium TaxID=2283094 RepID=A0A6J4PYE4_9BACT|nr:MAG: hypothetical protein AVDCRST_MAG74-3141 [uncultured Pyrinomonadaceae bacterium]
MAKTFRLNFLVFQTCLFGYNFAALPVCNTISTLVGVEAPACGHLLYEQQVFN